MMATMKINMGRGMAKKCCKDLEKLVPSCTADRNEDSAAALENSRVVPHTAQQRVSIRCSDSAPRYIPQRNENDVHTKACT